LFELHELPFCLLFFFAVENKFKQKKKIIALFSILPTQRFKTSAKKVRFLVSHQPMEKKMNNSTILLPQTDDESDDVSRYLVIIILSALVPVLFLIILVMWCCRERHEDICRLFSGKGHKELSCVHDEDNLKGCACALCRRKEPHVRLLVHTENSVSYYPTIQPEHDHHQLQTVSLSKIEPQKNNMSGNEVESNKVHFVPIILEERFVEAGLL
jgi:hypothetical protein